MNSIIGCIIGIILYHIIIKPIEVRKNRQWCIDHGLVPSDTSVDEVNHGMDRKEKPPIEAVGSSQSKTAEKSRRLSCK